MKTSTLMILIVSAVSLLITQGCVGRLVSEGVGSVTGAKGTYMELQPVGEATRSTALADYTNFEMAPFGMDPGVRVPLMFTESFPDKFRQYLAKEKLPQDSRGKTLVIRGRILHYESAGLAGEIFGPFEEVIARVELVDKESGKVLGVANCIGRSQESVNKGAEDKAEGLAKAVVAWIKANRTRTR